VSTFEVFPTHKIIAHKIIAHKIIADTQNNCRIIAHDFLGREETLAEMRLKL
jgi:hypothetical protein